MPNIYKFTLLWVLIFFGSSYGTQSELTGLQSVVQKKYTSDKAKRDAIGKILKSIDTNRIPDLVEQVSQENICVFFEELKKIPAKYNGLKLSLNSHPEIPILSAIINAKWLNAVCIIANVDDFASKKEAVKKYLDLNFEKKPNAEINKTKVSEYYYKPLPNIDKLAAIVRTSKQLWLATQQLVDCLPHTLAISLWANTGVYPLQQLTQDLTNQHMRMLLTEKKLINLDLKENLNLKNNLTYWSNDKIHAFVGPNFKNKANEWLAQIGKYLANRRFEWLRRWWHRKKGEEYVPAPWINILTDAQKQIVMDAYNGKTPPV